MSVNARGSKGHPTSSTANRLIDCTVELLGTRSAESLTVALVLEHSGVSHGSLYHHFEDFPDLVEHAVLQRYIRRLRDGTAAMSALMDSADATEFRTRVEALFREFVGQHRAPNRMDQVEVLGSLNGRPRLAERIANAQRELTDERTLIFVECQRRGWVRNDVDPAALSEFLQGMVMGRVLDDVVNSHIDADHWEQIALIAFRAAFFGT